MLLALTGCGDPALVARTAFEEDLTCSRAMHLFACVVPEGETAAEVPDALDVEGTVVAAGFGEPPEGCLDPDLWTGGTSGEVDTRSAWWFRVEDGVGERWTVAALAADAWRPVGVGEPVRLVWTHGDRGDRTLALFDRYGDVLLWTARAETLEALAVMPEARLARGETTRACLAACGVVEQFSVDLTMHWETWPHWAGSRGEHLGYDVLLGDAWAALDDTCPEGGVSVAFVAL